MLYSVVYIIIIIIIIVRAANAPVNHALNEITHWILIHRLFLCNHTGYLSLKIRKTDEAEHIKLTPLSLSVVPQSLYSPLPQTNIQQHVIVIAAMTRSSEPRLCTA